VNNDLLVCFAVQEEAKGFRIPEPLQEQVHVLVTGMGRRNAANAVEAALKHRGWGLVLTCGFAGGLNPELAVGTVVLEAGTSHPICGILTRLGAVAGHFHCVDRIASTVPEKRSLRQSSGADAVEMESAWISQVCRDHQVACATVRVISDAADEDLPLDFNALMTRDLRLDYAKLAWTLFKAPGTVGVLLKFQRQTRSAAKSLGGLLEASLRQYAAMGR
jgi:adenosylhomocysteine nucleosidase